MQRVTPTASLFACHSFNPSPGPIPRQLAAEIGMSLSPQNRRGHLVSLLRGDSLENATKKMARFFHGG